MRPRTELRIDSNTTIATLAEFMEEVGPDQRLRGKVGEGNTYVLYVRNRSFLEVLKENFLGKYQKKIEGQRKEALKQITTLLEKRTGGLRAESAMTFIRESLNDSTHDIRPAEFTSLLRDIDPEREDVVAAREMVERGWHGLVENRRSLPDSTTFTALAEIETLTALQKTEEREICNVLAASNPDNTETARRVTSELLHYLHKQVAGSGPIIDFISLSDIQNLQWPSEEAIGKLPKKLQNSIKLLKTFSEEIRSPSTLKCCEKHLAEVSELLTPKPPAKKPTSIPDLIKSMISASSNDADDPNNPINSLKRVIDLGTHQLSTAAINVKFLAILAFTQDSGCIAESGKFNIERILAVMKNWFKNEDGAMAIDIDDGALKQMLAGLSLDRNQGCIRLSHSGEPSVSLEKISAIRKTIDANLQESGLGSQELRLDFSKVPLRTVATKFNEAVLGDMNGNSLMLLHKLVSLGFANIATGKEGVWEQLVDCIERNDIKNFRKLLFDTIQLTATDKKLVLLGDLLSDRASNDWFTLCILDLLHENKQNFEIIISNHDLGFIEYFLYNKDKTDNQKYSCTVGDLKHQTAPYDSLEKLNNSLNNDPSQRADFLRMTEHYLSHLKIVSCSADQQTFLSHGIVNQHMLDDMLEQAGVSKESAAEMKLPEKIAKINEHVQANAFKDLNNYQLFFKNTIEGKQKEPNPFLLAAYNIGPFSTNYSVIMNPDHRYNNAVPIEGALRMVHGHTEPMQTRLAQETELAELFQRLYELTVGKTSPGAAISNIGEILGLLTKPVTLSANGEFVGPLLLLSLLRIEALSVNLRNSNSSKDIKTFFEKLKEINMTAITNEASWFTDYKSSELNDPIAQEKTRQKIQGIKFPNFQNVPANSEAMETIKSGFKQAKKEHDTKIEDLAKQLGRILESINPNIDLQETDNLVFLFRCLAEAKKMGAAEKNLKITLEKLGNTLDESASILMYDSIHTEYEKIRQRPLLRKSQEEKIHMESYISLDSPFGGSMEESQGSRLVFLA